MNKPKYKNGNIAAWENEAKSGDNYLTVTGEPHDFIKAIEPVMKDNKFTGRYKILLFINKDTPQETQG